jgi:DNA-binding PadR family transcriptional regulator
VAGLFGLSQGEQPRGPRARRGDVRAAILDVLRSEPLNGYQIIGQIGERSDGAWKPSPGSVYPTLQQLEDEGLVEADEERGRRSFRLTAEGSEYVEANADELAAVWRPFEVPRGGGGRSEFASLKPEIGQVMSAVWQIISTGTEAQRREAIDVLVDTRRRLYGILAEGDNEEEAEE